ncbi:unnamed protein product [Phytophthora fragariaefolia]|uniref:Unnamed protein product n=1 Tax=Phytophthora fragariaefolia TaxID=1490495 RepID=A0A9W7CZE9_9STRA|nr:unnamed protein product [Phytophthora fragariaefolia]
MREQQQFMAQTAELQRQVAAAFQQQQEAAASPSPQTQDTSAADSREYRAEGITMPKFSGHKDDDVADYLFSANLYFESKSIKYGAEAPQQRPLSLLVANLKGHAAAWYLEYVSHDGNFLHSVQQFEELLASEFTAPDRQEHLSDQLLRLRQNNFMCLEDYVSAFRHIICKVEDMSDIDKVMCFQKGLVVEIWQEVKLRQFRNTTDAISFALMYDRTHAVSSRGHSRASVHREGRVRHQVPQPPPTADAPTPVEIGSSQFVSHEECMRNNLCFYCKESGHRLAMCRKRPARNNPRGAPRQQQGSTTFRANQGAFRRVVEDDTDDEEVLESMQLNMVSVDAPKGEQLRFSGTMNGRSMRVLIDSGAELNIIRPGLAEHLVDTTKITAERFDESTTPARTALRCPETLRFDGRDFADVLLIEWDVTPNQDVILGHPWLLQFNRSINWKTSEMHFPVLPSVTDASTNIPTNSDSADKSPAHRMLDKLLQDNPAMDRLEAWQQVVPLGYYHAPLHSDVADIADTNDDDPGDDVDLEMVSASDFESKVKDQAYLEVYHVRVKTAPQTKVVTLLLQPVLEEFSDVFPATLPPELPPTRSIEHEVVLKPGAQPSNRSPFRLSKVEQDALELFVF